MAGDSRHEGGVGGHNECAHQPRQRRCQKSYLSMLSALKRTGSPTTTVLFSPIVRSPRFPAVNFSPTSPLIAPLSSAAPAYAATYPSWAGSHRANSLTVPSFTKAQAGQNNLALVVGG